MNRVVRTSTGWVVLDVHWMAFTGITCEVTAFNDDAGWETAARAWGEKAADTSLPELVASLAQIPVVEAEQIVEDTLAEWRSRGGEGADRKVNRSVAKLLVPTFGLVALGAVALLGIVAWLVAGWL